MICPCPLLKRSKKNPRPRKASDFLSSLRRAGGVPASEIATPACALVRNDEGRQSARWFAFDALIRHSEAVTDVTAVGIFVVPADTFLCVQDCHTSAAALVRNDEGRQSADWFAMTGTNGQNKNAAEDRQRIYQPRESDRPPGREPSIKRLFQPYWNGGIWYKRTHGREFH